MNTVKMIFAGVSISLYSALLLKVFLEIFLVKKSGYAGLAGWFPFFLWQICINSEIICIHPLVNMMLTFAAILSVGVISYEGILWKRWLYPIIFAVIWMLLRRGSEAYYGYLNQGQNPSLLFHSVFTELLLLIMIMGIRQFMNLYRDKILSYNGGAYLGAFLLSGMLLYPVFYMLAETTGSKGTDSFGWFLMAALILTVMNVSMYSIYLRLAEAAQMKRNVNMYIEQLEYYGRQYDLESAATAEIQEAKHDMKQRLIYLQELAKTDQKEQLLETLENLIGKSVNIGQLKSRTGNLIIDAMVNHLWEKACKKGILLHTKLDVPRAMKIKDEDLGIFLGNAFDNALEASEYVEKGKGEIWIEITYEKGYLYINIKNRYQGKIKQNKERGLVTRKEEAFHGWGMKSMKKIAKKYHGNVELDWKGDIFLLETIFYDDK